MKLLRRIRDYLYRETLSAATDKYGTPRRSYILGNGLLIAGGVAFASSFIVAVVGGVGLQGAWPGIPWWFWQVTLAPLPPLAAFLTFVKVASLWDLRGHLNHLNLSRFARLCEKGAVRLDGLRFASAHAHSAHSALTRLDREQRRLLGSEVDRLAGEVHALLAAAARARIIRIESWETYNTVVAEIERPGRRSNRGRKVIEGAYEDLVALITARLDEIDAVTDAAHREAEARIVHPEDSPTTLTAASLLSARRELEADVEVWESTAKLFIERARHLEAAREEVAAVSAA